MFIYHYRVKNWFVYSCPGRVILISQRSTLAVYYINHGNRIQRKQIKTYGKAIRRKKPTLKYIIPILGRIVDNRYRIISSDYTVGKLGAILQDWEEKILVDVGFYD